jgi:hypothetical protein
VYKVEEREKLEEEKALSLLLRSLDRSTCFLYTYSLQEEEEVG